MIFLEICVKSLFLKMQLDYFLLYMGIFFLQTVRFYGVTKNDPLKLEE